MRTIGRHVAAVFGWLGVGVGIVFSQTGFADSNCLSRHMSEAMLLNTQRTEPYAAASGGQSIEISKGLIKFEKSLLLTSPILEVPANIYGRFGIPVLCDDLMSMSLVPTFQASVEPPQEVFVPLNIFESQKSLFAARSSGSFEKLESEIEVQLTELQATPSYHCLVRHFLESTLRSVQLLPSYRRQAKVLHLPSPSTIMWAYIDSQIVGLREANRLDTLAGPLQADGVPILCQDIPHIPAISGAFAN